MPATHLPSRLRSSVASGDLRYSSLARVSLATRAREHARHDRIAALCGGVRWRALRGPNGVRAATYASGERSEPRASRGAPVRARDEERSDERAVRTE